MTITRVLILILAAAGAAHADFSYIVTTKGMPAGAMNQPTKYFLKGNKLMTDLGSVAIVLDFDAQTVTSFDRSEKTYTVKKFADEAATAPQGAKVNADFKVTGQHKTINGLDATQAVMTMQIEMPQTPGRKSQMEIEYWISPDVPGASELESFYKRNLDKFPWSAMGAGGNPGMRAAMTEMQKRLGQMHGAPVLQIVRNKIIGGPSMTPQQQAQMAQARARLEAMQQQGGPQAAAAAQALASMGAATSGGGMEITMESSGFSTGSIPQSTFAVPAGFQQK